MTAQSGVILLDKNEVIIRVYKKDTSAWQTIYNQNFDLETFNKHFTVEASQIIEIIAQISLSPETAGTESWQIGARNLPENVFKSIKEATGLPGEILTLEREQELICKGLLCEEG